MCYVMIIAYLANIFSSKITAFWVVAANVSTILSTILAVCGLSLVDFWLGKVVKQSGLRVLIYVGALIAGGMLISLLINGLVILGVLDSGRDFRQLGKNED